MPTKTTEQPIYELTNVEVETLGLVNRGANGEAFFLLKGETDGASTGVDETGTTEMQTADQSAVEAAVTKSVWQKLIELFKQGFVEENYITPEESVAPDTTVTKTDETTAVVETLVVEPEQTVEKEETPPTLVEVVVKDTTIIESPVPSDPATISEAVSKEEHLMADEATFSKADYDALLTRLSKTEAELQKANDEKERQTYIAKAQLYSYIPVATTELAEHLHKLAKSDSGEAAWWEDVLKAMDNMVTDSAMFSERGSVQMPTSALDAVMKSDNPKEALLNLPKHEAEAYLRKVRGGK